MTCRIATWRPDRCDPLARRRILVLVNPANRASAIEVPPELLARARGGELAAFEQLYRLFERPVYGLALRLTGHVEDAMDVLHDAMLKALQGIRGYRGDAPFWPWLRQIAVNEALMRLRRREPVEFVEELPEPEAGSETSLPQRAVEHAELERALAALPKVTRSVLWLYHAEGFTHEEIAALMGRSISFSKSQLARGSRRLRQLLDSAEVPSHV